MIKKIFAFIVFLTILYVIDCVQYVWLNDYLGFYIIDNNVHTITVNSVNQYGFDKSVELRVTKFENKFNIIIILPQSFGGLSHDIDKLFFFIDGEQTHRYKYIDVETFGGNIIIDGDDEFMMFFIQNYLVYSDKIVFALYDQLNYDSYLVEFNLIGFDTLFNILVGY